MYACLIVIQESLFLLSKFIFLQRIINDWNSLPHDVVSASNVFIFKTKLDVYIFV